MKLGSLLKGGSHGVRLPEHKHHTETPVEKFPLPEKIIIPLQQHIGAPCKATVKKGDKVLAGQLIGDSEAFVSCPVHSSISGEVSGTLTLINPPSGQLIESIVITSDKEDNWIELEPSQNIESLSVQDIISKIRKAGIVGMGGATFPTPVKLSPRDVDKIDSVILNGCECEPYITADHRVMLEYGEQVLSGLTIISKILPKASLYIAIEDNKLDAIAHMEELVDKSSLKGKCTVISLRSQYPMGAEKTLIKNVLGREVPIGGLPMDVGAIVHNVGTSKAIHDAVLDGKPLVERVITITGAVNNPKNLLVRVGTPIKDLIEYCGGIKSNANEIILGGPMMGISVPTIDFPVTKGTSCVLVMESRPIKESDCIRCGTCIGVCPMNLMSTTIAKYAKAGLYDECKANYIDNCVECGCCAYVCPANIPLVQYIKTAKKELLKRKTN